MHDEARDAFEQIAAHATKGSFAEQPTVDVSVPKYGYTLRVRVPNEPDAERRCRFEKSTVEWLRQPVRMGDVFYDIDAGIGAP